MMEAYERLMKYAAIPSASDAAQDCCPSTASQLAFAEILEKEMRELGLSDVTLDAHGYLYAWIPATPGLEELPAIGFIAHIDVVDSVPFENVKPRLVEYAGGDVVLGGDPPLVLRAEALKNYIGDRLIVTDGTTLLGADDKAGIAEILTACERILADDSIRHGRICIGFTPDEEIGRGADLFDVEKFGAAWAYTLDGGSFGEVSFENFNASSLTVEITGKSYHPGGAKNKMVNAAIVAMEYHAMLPALERPEHTEGYEGFYHLTGMSGDVESARLSYILRDHDAAKLEYRKAYAVRAADELNRRYGEGTVKLTQTDSYRNMRERIETAPHVIKRAYDAITRLGGKPYSHPVRGGTDGARLSFMGLPCPNLGTGSANHHGRLEFAVAGEMEKCVRQVIEIARA